MNDTGGGAEEETTRPEIGFAFDSAVRNLFRLLFELKAACDAMDGALRTTDAMNLESAVKDVACGWQAAQRALGVLVACADEARAHVPHAHAALDEHRLVLDDLLRRTLLRVDDSAMRERVGKSLAELGPLVDRSLEQDGVCASSHVVPVLKTKRSVPR